MSKIGIAAAAALAMAATAAKADIITYSGQDQGASINGPFPVSSGIESSFLGDAATFGPVVTETFEGTRVGVGANGNTTFAITGATITLNGYAPGVMGSATDNVHAFNTTPGGSHYLNVSGSSITVNFNTQSNSFGFYTTGVQKDATKSLYVTFFDGSSQKFNLPVNTLGGASYFGFTDDLAIQSVTITNLPQPGTQYDNWGIDNVSFNYGRDAAPSAPEPSTWLLMIAGVGFAGAALRRRGELGRAVLRNA